MAYTAMEKMRRENRQRFGEDLGPMQPPLYCNRRQRNDLKSAALRFLRGRCEGLRFDADKERQEAEEKIWLGKSLKAGQIPYNMEMDINRLCLEKALEAFIDSGVAEDAYAVYYCWLEIFFGQYGKSKKMVELLSEYEANGSALLMKHRDHYSHSVYVFALGLAVYETNETYRRIFRDFYGLASVPENEAANLFLEYWGLTSLFHDIGYPFEIPFEQVLSYFEVNNRKRGEGCLYLAYRSVEALTVLEEGACRRFEALYGKCFRTTSELLAFALEEKLGAAYGFSEADMLDVLNAKPTEPERFGYYMDHAFFSAARLYAELYEILGPDRLNEKHVDVLTAIVLHNSLFKFSIAFYKDPENCRAPLKAELHPLAWLLMLCDELQCWDRTAYGRNSRTEIHPMSADFDFSGGAIAAVYDYDEAESEKIEAFHLAYAQWQRDPAGQEEPRLKAYSDMAGEKRRFTADIEKIVDTSFIPLTVGWKLCRPDRKSKRTYLSGSSFLHLYDFAVALHARNMPPDTAPEAMEATFNERSLEYRLATLLRARNFARYLDAVHCFYTDRPVGYELVTRFGPKEAAIFAPMEHERWVREHQAMGWRYGTAYETLPLSVPKEQEKEERTALRERLRCHKLMMDGRLTHDEIRAHYRRLSKADQDKDWKPFNTLLALLKKFDGLRIYRL
ncbi:MAG: hypothetical protein IJQ02_06120 [Oscillospiraceae bacterium]|nr:hypothetical protein [Oscillospiraceae bacterium]